MLQPRDRRRCWLETEGAPPRQLEPVDLAWCRMAWATCCAASSGRRPARCFERPRENASASTSEILFGDTGQQRTWAPAASLCELHAPLRQVLRPRCCLRRSSSTPPTPDADWLHGTLRLMAAEGAPAAPRRRYGDHAAGRHPGDPGHPRLDRVHDADARKFAGTAGVSVVDSALAAAGRGFIFVLAPADSRKPASPRCGSRSASSSSSAGRR